MTTIVSNGYYLVADNRGNIDSDYEGYNSSTSKKEKSVFRSDSVIKINIPKNKIKFKDSYLMAYANTGYLSNSDQFGYSVSISSDGSRMIVGAPYKNTNTGAAYIFSRSGTTWTQEAKVSHNDPASNDDFGNSVSISSDGSRVVIGAYGKNSARGAAYIFSRSGTTWTQEAKLQSSDIATGDYFGDSASISSDGSRVIVGASGKNSYTGAAYIFSRSGTTWTQEAKLTHSDPASNDYFGVSVSISGDGSRVIAGALGKTSGTGAAYIFS